MADKFTREQLYTIGTVYDKLAKLLPLEGRDYTVEFSFPDGKAPSLKLTPLTKFGGVWVKYCQEQLAQTRRPDDSRAAAGQHPSVPGQ